MGFSNVPLMHYIWKYIKPDSFHFYVMAWKDHLRDIYFDLRSPISYAGPEKIYQYLRKEGKY